MNKLTHATQTVLVFVREAGSINAEGNINAERAPPLALTCKCCASHVSVSIDFGNTT